jgi:LuxR family maltose regulon positive regulatory protein
MIVRDDARGMPQGAAWQPPVPDVQTPYPDPVSAYPCEFENLTLARVLIAQGRADPTGAPLRDALALLGRLLSAAEAGGRMGAVIEARVLQALAHVAQGDRQAGLAAIAPAVELAAPEGFVRLFADEGAPLAAFVAQIAERGAQKDTTRAYAQSLLAAFASEQRRETASDSEAPPVLPLALGRSSGLVEPLTERELEVLRLIADGAENREIAEQLMITIGTVKRHINNLFGKLGARSRTQALRVARDCGLL